MSSLFNGKELWLSLTGGRDSRLTLAFCKTAGLSIKAYTYDTKVYPKDGKIAKRISKKLKLDHVFVTANLHSRERQEEFEKHTSGMVNDFERQLYTYNMLQPLKNRSNKDIVILGSNYWEQILNYYERKYTDRDDVMRKFSMTHPFMREEIKDWFEMLDKDGLNRDIPFLKRIYWDLRCGCWGADKWQAWDLEENVHIVQLFNCRRFLGLLMGASPELLMKEDKLIEVKITNKVCPELTKIPYEDEIMDFNDVLRVLIKITKMILPKLIFEKVKRLIKK